MNGHNFILAPVDTDSISFAKEDGAEFTEEEQKELIKEVNTLFPELIKYEHDGYYKKVICVKAKNYVLWDGMKIVYKGSSLKNPTKEIALNEFIKEIVNCILYDMNNYSEIYNKYIKEIDSIQDMSRWVTRKTITEKTLNPQRTNEQKIKDVINNTDYVEGDKIKVFFLPNSTLELLENYKVGVYNKERFYEKLYKTAEVFDTILDVKTLFPNFYLKRNKEKLVEVLNGCS